MSNSESVQPDQPTTPPPPVPAAAPSQYTIFRGPNGIRAGWRLLIYFAIGAALFAALFTILRAFGQKPNQVVQQISPGFLSLNEGTGLLFACLAALVMARIERRAWGQYGLPLRFAFGKDFWIGAVVGFSSISVCLLAIFALHGFRVVGLAIHGSTIVISILAWTGAFALVGLSEEFSFRGYPQFTLTTGIGYWPSAVIFSTLFGLAHAGNSGEDKFGVVSVVLFALLFCLFLRRRGNLWWAVGFHAGWDWGQTFFYGVPDSGFLPYHSLFQSSLRGPRWLTGGTVGPEASIFTPIVLGIVAVLFARTYRQNLYTTSTAATVAPDIRPQRSDVGPAPLT